MTYAMFSKRVSTDYSPPPGTALCLPNSAIPNHHLRSCPRSCFRGSRRLKFFFLLVCVPALHRTGLVSVAQIVEYVSTSHRACGRHRNCSLVRVFRAQFWQCRWVLVARPLVCSWLLISPGLCTLPLCCTLERNCKSAWT